MCVWANKCDIFSQTLIGKWNDTNTNLFIQKERERERERGKVKGVNNNKQLKHKQNDKYLFWL